MSIKEALTKTKWEIDPSHSEVDFKIKHLMITNVKGGFKEFEASIYTTGKNFATCEINFCINPASINTEDEKRDEHLKGPDFFDVAKYKQIIFIGNSLEKVDHVGSFTLYGDLTIKGITNKIKLNVEYGGTMKDSLGKEKVGFSINGMINRKDWGLNWNSVLEAGGLLVSDQVAISCELQLTKQ
jgi:polyisoprenoid-binding protein YceI